MDILRIMKQSEFQILALAAGIEKIYGTGKYAPLSQQETMYGLHELIRNGILTEDNGQFLFCEPYRTIFMELKNADRLLAVTSEKSGTQDVSIYKGKKLITLEESRQDAGALRIGQYELQELPGLLEEKGFLPDAYVPLDIALLQPQEELEERLAPGMRELLMSAEKMDLSGEMQEQLWEQFLLFDLKNQGMQEPFEAIYLLENPCNYWIAVKNRENVEYTQYAPQRLCDRLREIF